MVDVLPEVAVVFPYELIQLRKLLAYAAGVFDAVLPGSNSSLLLRIVVAVQVLPPQFLPRIERSKTLKRSLRRAPIK